jgi:hypothetical protein
MTEITMRLPIELANAIYTFVGRSPVAEIIKAHLEKKEGCICDLCNEDTDPKHYLAYANKCEMCYISENPHLNTGLGRNCDTCNEELHMYKWAKISGIDGGEYCMDCYNHQME